MNSAHNTQHIDGGPLVQLDSLGHRPEQIQSESKSSLGAAGGSGSVRTATGLSIQKEYENQSKLGGYLTVATGICIHLFCGNLYLWGNISTYVVSYFHDLGDPDATLSFAVALLPLSFTIQSCANPLGSYLQKRINPRIIMGTGASIMIVSIYVASIMKSWWGFVLWYCVGFPLGIGLVYWPPIMCGWEWFPNNKGLVSGLVVGGYGFGAFIFGFVSTGIANPNNLPTSVPADGSGTTDKLFPPAVADNVPRMFHTCLIYWSILAGMAVIGVTRNPVFVKEEEQRLRAEKFKSHQPLPNETQDEGSSALEEPYGNQNAEFPSNHKNFIEVREGLTSRQFWHMGFMLLFGMFFGLFMAGVYKQTALDYLSDRTLTLAGALGSVCNGTSRIIWAALQDRFGFRPVYFVLLCLQLVVSCTIYSVRSNGALYVIWVSCAFLCEGGHFSMFPTAAVKLFGIQNGGYIFTIMFFFIPVSSIAGFLVIQFGKDYISFATVYWIAGALTAINIVLLYLFDDSEMLSKATRELQQIQELEAAAQNAPMGQEKQTN